MQETEVIICFVTEWFEKGRIELEGNGDGREDFPVEGVALEVEVLHKVPELNALRVKGVRPVVWHSIHALLANLHRFFQVEEGSSTGIDFGFVLAVINLLPSVSNIPSIAFRIPPFQFVLLLLGTRKEGLGMREGGGDEIGRESVVLEVYEASGLEAFEDGLGGGEGLGGGAGGEGGEVDYLLMLEKLEYSIGYIRG